MACDVFISNVGRVALSIRRAHDAAKALVIERPLLMRRAAKSCSSSLTVEAVTYDAYAVVMMTEHMTELRCDLRC